MWNYPEIDPVALALGPVQIHWYGLMYLLGFLGFWLLGTREAKRSKDWTADYVSDFLFYGALGVMIGGRVGHILFYDLVFYIDNPLAVFKVWQGGMSFHGGLLGVTLAMFWFARKKMNVSILVVSDFVALMVPIGLFFGRIGNFINGELWGKVVDSPGSILTMRVYDSQIGQVVSKYPTQLLQAFLEGLVLLVVLYAYTRKKRALGSVTGLFLGLYGFFRFLVEFYRVPEEPLGYLMWNWVTMGQVLSLPMIIIGFGMVVWANKRHNKPKIAK